MNVFARCQQLPGGTQTPLTFFAFFFLLLGLCVGSFLNVVAWRVPAGRSIVRPGSACPSCGNPIRWYDNVPVLSFLLLGARCRQCRSPISPLYPAVELATGLLFLGAALRAGPGLQAAADAVLASLMVLTVRTDLENWLVLDEASLGGLAAGLAFALAPGGLSVLQSAGAAAGGFVLFLLIRLASLAVLKAKPGYVLPPPGHEDEADEFTGGMGWGDVKLAACIGAFLGPGRTAVAFFVAFVTGAAAGIAMILSGRHEKRRPMPFGPFLALGALVSMFAGNALLSLYLSASWP
ncbi:prepilin peptidase [Candidatus Fermentibacteria bacterium]|nr:prepilin peptidase [Candidatus Fermentibacteria bacterium]